MAQVWLIVAATAAGVYWFVSTREAEDKARLRPQVNLDVTLKQPIADPQETSFVHTNGLSSKDYQLVYVGPAARGQKKYQYRDLINGQKFHLYRPIETVLRS